MDAPVTASVSAADADAEPTPARTNVRIHVVVAPLILVWLVLAGRLVQLQWLDAADLTRRAARQHSLTETIPARPGDIVDRHGRILATTVTARSLFVVPSAVADPWQTSLDLAEAVGVDSDRLFERLGRNPDSRFLWVKRRITEEEADRVRALELPPPSWGFREEYLRRYPQGTLAAHVLGLRDIDGHGRGGVEQTFDDVLAGAEGKHELLRDARGRVLDVRAEIAAAAKPGETVTLTIDSVVQLFLERELAAVAEEWEPGSACGIVMDVESGDVLALASWPTFDPGHPVGVVPEAWKNTAIASIFEPGSTFKPFVVARAVDSGVLRRDDRLHCENGAYRMGRRVLHDHHPYGELSVTDVLVKSSNIGMAKIGERLGNVRLFETATAFGFGRRTGIELPGELVGLLRPLEKWNGYSTGSIPMGQEIAVTPLQLVTAHAALARGGPWRSPRLVREVGNVKAEAATVTSPTVSADVARWVVAEPMEAVVDRGTGRRARIDGVSVFGKTGTAQKVDPETGRYSNTRHTCSFICGAPADDPWVLVLISVDEPTRGSPHYGGTVAAPAAKAVLANTLRHLGRRER